MILGIWFWSSLFFDHVVKQCHALIVGLDIVMCISVSNCLGYFWVLWYKIIFYFSVTIFYLFSYPVILRSWRQCQQCQWLKVHWSLQHRPLLSLILLKIHPLWTSLVLVLYLCLSGLLPSFLLFYCYFFFGENVFSFNFLDSIFYLYIMEWNLCYCKPFLIQPCLYIVEIKHFCEAGTNSHLWLNGWEI